MIEGLIRQIVSQHTSHIAPNILFTAAVIPLLFVLLCDPSPFAPKNIPSKSTPPQVVSVVLSRGRHGDEDVQDERGGLISFEKYVVVTKQASSGTPGNCGWRW